MSVTLTIGEAKIKERSRSRNASFPVTTEYNVSTGLPTGVTFGGGTLVESAIGEKIVYTVSPKGEPYRFNMCNHWTNTLSMPLSRGIRVDHQNGIVYYDWHEDNGLVKAYHGSIVDTHCPIIHTLQDYEVVVPSWDQDSVNAGFASTQPDLTRLSLPNFFVELDDVRRVTSLFAGFRLRFLRNYRRYRAQNIPLGVAGVRLGIEYGIKTLYQDLDSLTKSLITIRDTLGAWNSTAGEFLTHRYQISSTSSSDSGIDVIDANTSMTWDTSSKEEVYFFAKYRTKPIDGINRASVKLRGVLDTLGFELNPAIVWDALPFTFVVDYFINVGRVLESFKLDTLKLPVELVDCCVQVTNEHRCSSTSVYTHGSGQVTRSAKAEDTARLFQRVPCWPDGAGFAPFDWYLPSSHQAINLVALGTALLGGRRR